MTTEKGGRPFIYIDLEELEQVCRLNCTVEEIAAFFNVSKRTIDYRMAEDEAFREIVEKGRAQGKLSIRRAQMQHLNAGSEKMAIYLGKVVCGQREVTETVSDTRPISIEIVNPYALEDGDHSTH